MTLPYLFVLRSSSFLSYFPKGIGFEVAEYMVLGTDHAEVGARILENWGFPLDLVNAVGWHHDPQTC